MELEIISASDCHVPVLGLEALVRYDARVGRAQATSLQSGVDVVGPEVGQCGDL